MRSLQLKIIVPIVSALILVFTIEAVGQWRERQAELVTSLQDHTHETSSVVEGTLRHAMLKADFEAVDTMMRRLGEMPVVRRAFIVSNTGIVFRSSDTTMNDKPAKDALVGAVLASHRDSSAYAKAADGRPYISGVVAFRADKACLECHDELKVGEAVGYLTLERWATKEEAALRSSQIKAIGISFAVVILLGIGLSLITRMITKPMAAITTAAARIAEGDIEQEMTVRSNDELGALADSFRGMMAYVREVARGADALRRGDTSAALQPRGDKDVLTHSFIQLQTTIRDLAAETNTLAEYARQGALDRRGDEQRFDGAFRDLVHGMNEMMNAVNAPLTESAQALQRLAARDLSVRMEGAYKGQYAIIKDAMNQATTNLDEALADVSAAAREVASASGQIRNGSQALAASASAQAGSLEEVGSALQELASSARKNTASASDARELSGAVRDTAVRGEQHMNDLAAAMDRIKESADATARIVKTIEEISFQTNLLALNASVEAARAGSAGLGFAVVADEVRALAKRSADAAQNTAALIEESVRNAAGGVEINKKVLTDLREIRTQATRATGVIAEIADASAAQSHGVDQINASVDHMNQSVQDTAANSEEAASATVELTGQASTLEQLVRTFTLSGDGTTRTLRLEASPPRRALKRAVGT
jgi:methyl-accepting chemotaxis protein